MAEALTTDTKLSEKKETLECAVCLQPCVHPAQLPCGHIFCYLCVKGFANQNKKCAMCRQEIPRDFIDQPHLLEKPQSLDTQDGFDGGYQWFYEGRNGWWQYDERTSKELETFYKKGEKTSELLIAGFLYVVDLENMVQLRRNDPSRRRNIKRDLANIPKKGIAGLRTAADDQCEAPEVRSASPIEGTTENMVPVTPSNTPQSPTSGRESPSREEDLQATVERISNLRLDSNENTGDNTNSNHIDRSASSEYFSHQTTD